MVAEALNLGQVETRNEGVVRGDQASPSRQDKLKFPALKIEKVRKQREEHRKLLESLFPKPVSLQRLIINIEKNFAEQFASIIGSKDFAEARLAGLFQALKELADKVESVGFSTDEELREHIAIDPRIHESFEDLIFDCAKFSLEEVAAN